MHTVLDLLNFVQLLLLFLRGCHKKAAHAVLLETKSLENTGLKSEGQKTFSSAAQKYTIYSLLK